MVITERAEPSPTPSRARPRPGTPTSLSLIVGARNLAGAGSGGTRATREMLACCAELHITVETEIVSAHDVNTSLDRLARNDLRYRFVLNLVSPD